MKTTYQTEIYLCVCVCVNTDRRECEETATVTHCRETDTSSEVQFCSICRQIEKHPLTSRSSLAGHSQLDLGVLLMHINIS